MSRRTKVYEVDQSYEWNYENAPSVHEPVTEQPVREVMFCGRKLPSPLGIAAGPLLNGNWVCHYASLGFDFLTYKTVRSRDRACYARPNLVPIKEEVVQAGQITNATADTSSWAISFGMPSKEPDAWRRDVAWTREQLGDEKTLSVSVVASAETDWTINEVADDYARCARWAVESGADCVELNLSCPNVDTVDGQLYQDLEGTRKVANRVRDAVGDVPIILKIGWVEHAQQAAEFLEVVHSIVDAISMTNCLACRVEDSEGKLLFQGQPRGIGGTAIKPASIAQIARFSDVIRRQNYSTQLIGVGGISTTKDVCEYLEAGATIVNLATAAMLTPDVGQHIRAGLKRESNSNRPGA